MNFDPNQTTLPRWVKWGAIILAIVIVTCIIYSIFLYRSIVSSKTEGFSETKEHVLQTTDITEVTNITRFHGDKYYQVVSGKTSEGVEEIAFVPMEKKNEPIVIQQKEILSEASILHQWKNECNNCTLIKIMPAYVDNKPLWEITYNDRSNRYVIDYLNMKDGSRYEQFRFKKMFD